MGSCCVWRPEFQRAAKVVFSHALASGTQSIVYPGTLGSFQAFPGSVNGNVTAVDPDTLEPIWTYNTGTNSVDSRVKRPVDVKIDTDGSVFILCDGYEDESNWDMNQDRTNYAWSGSIQKINSSGVFQWEYDFGAAYTYANNAAIPYSLPHITSSMSLHDGKIYAGSILNSSSKCIWVINDDGTLSASYGPGSWTNPTGGASAVWDTKLLNYTRGYPIPIKVKCDDPEFIVCCVPCFGTGPTYYGGLFALDSSGEVIWDIAGQTSTGLVSASGITHTADQRLVTAFDVRGDDVLIGTTKGPSGFARLRFSTFDKTDSDISSDSVVKDYNPLVNMNSGVEPIATFCRLTSAGSDIGMHKDHTWDAATAQNIPEHGYSNTLTEFTLNKQTVNTSGRRVLVNSIASTESFSKFYIAQAGALNNNMPSLAIMDGVNMERGITPRGTPSTTRNTAYAVDVRTV